MKISSTFSGISKFCLSLLFVSVYISSFATIHTITVQNYSFSPNVVSAVVGDTVVWQWVNGSHTTTSSSVPSGATAWDHSLSASSTTFTYILTTPGAYSFYCNVHGANTMSGSLSVASGTTGITNPDIEHPVMYYPQPFKNNLTINLNGNANFSSNITVQVYDILGALKFEREYNEQLYLPLTLDLSDLNWGVYLVSVISGTNHKTFKVVKSQ